MNDRGTSMIEFAFGSFLFLGLIGVVFDFSIGYHRYSLLTDMTTQIARRAAIDLVIHDGENCADLEDEVLNTTAKHYYQDELNLDGYLKPYDETTNPHGVRFGARMDLCDGAPKIVVRSKLNFECFFCMLANTPYEMTTTSRIPIEKGSFACAGFVGAECPNLPIHL